MKKIPHLLFLLIMLVTSSCTTNESKPLFKEVDPNLQLNVENLIGESGVRSLMGANASWEELHDNYKEVTQKHIDNPYLYAYKALIINHQVLRTSLLEDINETNHDILVTYLEDLKSIKQPYTKVNYLVLNTVSPYLKKKELKTYAKESYGKALQMKDGAKAKLDLMPETDVVEKIAKEGLQKAYEEDYVEYPSKLKSSFIEE